MPRATHKAHVFTRLISKAENGDRLMGCSYGSKWAGCAETEIQHPSKSPIATFKRKPRQPNE